MGDAEVTEPYESLAALYDELVGDTAFECWRENYLRIIEGRGIEYDIAADVACGTGQAAEYLARKARVYAIDRSSGMLEVARERLRGLPAVLLCQSFSGLDLPEKAQLLTCNFDSLNYLADERELAEAFGRFRRCLEDGGYAMFDMNTARELALDGEQVMMHRVSGGFSVWESRWDAASRTNEMSVTNFVRRPDGLFSMSEEIHRERSFDVEVVVRLLGDAGFSRVEAFDARDLTGVGEGTRRVQFLARA